MTETAESAAFGTFRLVRADLDLALLRSVGSGEMFWETFRVESLDGGPVPAAALDPDAWRASAYQVRHQGCGEVLPVMSAGGRPPRVLDDGRAAVVELRGTYGFVPPEPSIWGRIRRRLSGWTSRG